MDEPLSSLDAKLREQMRREIRSLQKKLGLTIIYVTHDRTEALELSDRMAIMDHGKLVQIGTPEAVVKSPQMSSSRSSWPSHAVEKHRNISRTIGRGRSIFETVSCCDRVFQPEQIVQNGFNFA